MDELLQWFEDCVSWVVRLVKSIFGVGLDYSEDSVAIVLDHSLGWIILKIGEIEIPLTQYSLQDLIDALPVEVVDVLVALGFPEALQILSACYAARFGLQAIPMVRFGS